MEVPQFWRMINDNYGMAPENHHGLGWRVANARARWPDPTQKFHPDASSIPTPVPSRRRSMRTS